MKNEKLPIFEELDGCTGNAQRADWLKRVPLTVLLTYEPTIRNRCHNRHFAEGIAYCDMVLSWLRSVRAPDGGLTTLATDLAAAADRLMDEVIAREGRDG